MVRVHCFIICKTLQNKCANINTNIILFLFQLHSDQDGGEGSLKYILSGDGAGDVFIVNENTGDIQATKRLDREEKSVYILRAQAVNKKTGIPVEPESEFIIKIHDINDNEPKFTKDVYTATVPEMSEVGKCETLKKCTINL